MDVAFNKNVDESFTSSEIHGDCTKNCVQESVNLPLESNKNRQVKKTVI